MNPNNPLKQYFRQPAIYLRLPSQGKFYPDGALDMPVNGEIPIYPMTAIDEITYRTPDALFNGAAVINVIKSCAPNIRDPWAVPNIDIDSLLVAIRIASFGPNMEFESTCPKCGETNDHICDLRGILDRIKAPDYSKTVAQGDLEIFFKPMTYKTVNDNNLAQFEEQRILQSAQDQSIPEDQRLSNLNDAVKKITDITIKAMAHSIAAVKTPAAFVNEPEYIEDLLKNCDRGLFIRIRDFIIKIKEDSEMQPFEIECPEEGCKHKYPQSITLDMTSFFGAAS